MKVYVLMERQKRIGRCSDEIRDYVKGIYLNRESAESNAKIELENVRDIIRYDFQISYYIREWEKDF